MVTGSQGIDDANRSMVYGKIQAAENSNSEKNFEHKEVRNIAAQPNTESLSEQDDLREDLMAYAEGEGKSLINAQTGYNPRELVSSPTQQQLTTRYDKKGRMSRSDKNVTSLSPTNFSHLEQR